jgi:iron complex outermembrane receptor protein
MNAVQYRDFASNVQQSPGYPVDSALTFNNLSWRLAIDHQFADTNMVYASFSRGFKSGGFSLTNPTRPGFKPEILDAYETGVKSNSRDQKYQLNASIFYYDYRDVQVTAFTSPTSGAFILNGAKEELYGGELKAEAVLSRDLRVSGGFAYTKARYSSFPNSPCVSITPGPLYLANNICDVSGNTPALVAPWTGDVTANYTLLRRGGGALSLSGTYSYHGKYFADTANQLELPAYNLVSAALSWNSVGDRYRVQVWGKNLADEVVILQSAILTSVGVVSLPGPPRTYGITVGVNF